MKKARQFAPKRGKNYLVRRARNKNQEEFNEILLDGQWWRVRKKISNGVFLISDPSPIDDPNTLELDEHEDLILPRDDSRPDK